MGTTRIAAVTAVGIGGLALSVGLHAAWVFGIDDGYFNGGRLPLTPSVPVTPAWFAGLAATLSLLVAPFLFTALWFARKASTPTLHLIAGAIWLCGWLLIASIFATEFAVDFGATWLPWEPLFALMLRPVLTPALLVSGLLPMFFALRRGVR